MREPDPERKIEQDALILNPEDLYESALCGYATTSTSGRIVRANRTFLQWLGYELTEVTGGTRLVDLVTIGGRIFYETHIALMLRGQQAIREIALDFVRKDGSILPALLNARQQRNAAGEPTAVLWTVFDASERRKYERQLLAARDLFETTLASIGDGVISTDQDGAITFMNAVAAEMTGWDPDLAVGQPIDQVLVLVREDNGEPIENPIRHALRTGKRVGLENHTLLLSKDGNTYVVDDSAAPICNDDGLFSGAVMVFRDVSRRRQAERELNEAYRQLEQSAAELRRSNEDLTQFAYVASHDLRSPLKTVTMFSQLLERRYGDSLGDGKELLGHITDATKRMASLIEDLLRFSTISSSREVSSATAEANECLAIAIENLGSSVSESGAVIHSDSLPTIAVDRTSLVQLFQNLVGNAIRYRSSDPPCVRVSASRRDSFWFFSCRDNGIGIPDEHKERIFEPFKRLHGHEVPGNGIGLAVCKKVVERYGGTIWVESTPGEGSTFCFLLPAAVPKENARPAQR